MGSAEFPDADVIRQVCMPTFYMDETEVTVAQYEDCVMAGACDALPQSIRYTSNQLWNYPSSASDRADHPINGVDVDDAIAYCAWAGGRLPTEAEYEKASGGVDGRLYPWGD